MSSFSSGLQTSLWGKEAKDRPTDKHQQSKEPLTSDTVWAPWGSGKREGGEEGEKQEIKIGFAVFLCVCEREKEGE